MKVTLKILLVVAVFVLIYMCVTSITDSLNFDKEQKMREDAIISRLIDIRTAQIEYKNVHKVHAASFNELEKFLNEEKLPFILKEGVLTDEQLEKGMTEQQAVKEGLIVRDTIWVIAKDTLFGKDYNISDLRYVPALPGDKVEFTMDTATIISASGYEIKVFESGAKIEDYMRGMNPQLRYNLIDKAEKQEKFPGLRVGSLTEVNNNAGNWE